MAAIYAVSKASNQEFKRNQDEEQNCKRSVGLGSENGNPKAPEKKSRDLRLCVKDNKQPLRNIIVLPADLPDEKGATTVIKHKDLQKATLAGFVFRDLPSLKSTGYREVIVNPRTYKDLPEKAKNYSFWGATTGAVVGGVGKVFTWVTGTVGSLSFTSPFSAVIGGASIGAATGGIAAPISCILKRLAIVSYRKEAREFSKKLATVAEEIGREMQKPTCQRVFRGFIENGSFISKKICETLEDGFFHQEIFAEPIKLTSCEQKCSAIFEKSSIMHYLEQEIGKGKKEPLCPNCKKPFSEKNIVHCTETVQRLGYLVRKILDNLHGKSGKILVPEDLQGMPVSAMIQAMSPLAGPINRYCKLIMRFRRDYPGKLFDMGLYNETEYNRALEILVDWKRHWGLA
ncbi:MAG: hypothetical protein AAGF04_05380 [Chlamydiota bacterium]